MEALGRVQKVVANVEELMKVYRSKHSWLYAFSAFRLPSPLSASDAVPREARAEAQANLRRICQEAALPFDESSRELLKMAPRAEHYQSYGCNTRAAWGRAAAEWPEFQKGRRLVELFLIWKTASGNLERRFRRFREISCPERARLLDLTVENCMLVEQAPPSKMLRALPSSGPSADNNKYVSRVLKLHAKLQGETQKRIRRLQRRDAGSTRVPASGGSGPETEAAFWSEAK